MENRQLVPKYAVRYREVSAIKHVRYIEVPLYLELRFQVNVHMSYRANNILVSR